MTPNTLTVEEQIAALEREADKAAHGFTTASAIFAVSCEIRALRLMLREEIREAAWTIRKDTLAFAAEAGLQAYPKEALASRKAPDA